MLSSDSDILLSSGLMCLLFQELARIQRQVGNALTRVCSADMRVNRLDPWAVGAPDR